MIMWYLQYHLHMGMLCHSLMTVSFLVNVPVHMRETVEHFTPERQSLFESRAIGGGLPERLTITSKRIPLSDGASGTDNNQI